MGSRRLRMIGFGGLRSMTDGKKSSKAVADDLDRTPS